MLRMQVPPIILSPSFAQIGFLQRPRRSPEQLLASARAAAESERLRQVGWIFGKPPWADNLPAAILGVFQ